MIILPGFIITDETHEQTIWFKNTKQKMIIPTARVWVLTLCKPKRISIEQ